MNVHFLLKLETTFPQKEKRGDPSNAFEMKDNRGQLKWSPTEGLSQVAPLSW